MYLQQLTLIANNPSRRRLRPSSSDDIVLVPAVTVILHTVGWCAFLVAGARTWNDLSANVTLAPSLLTSRND